jgi:hypothetical protein
LLTVVIDTTVLGADWLLRSSAAAFVVTESTRGRLRLVVPELVVREAVNLHQREFRSTAKALREAARRHRRMSLNDASSELQNALGALDPQRATAEYETRLRELLDRTSAVIAPLPDVPHDQLVARALAGEPPFDLRGRNGYRDSLVWHTVLEVAQEHGRVAFVSRNASDFATTRKEPNKLADKLLKDVEELRDAGFPDAQVDLHPGLSEFVQSGFPPEEQAALELRSRLKKERDFRARVAEQLDGAWATSSPDWEVEGDIGADWEDQDLDMVGDVRDFHVEFTAAAEDEEVFVQLTGHADIQVEYTIRGTLDWFDDPPEIIDEIEWNERTETGRYIEVVPATLTFEALYRPGASELRNISLMMIKESWDWVEEGRVLGGPIDRDSR